MTHSACTALGIAAALVAVAGLGWLAWCAWRLREFLRELEQDNVWWEA